MNDKAYRWLHSRCDVFPVVSERRGYPEFVAYVYRLKRSDKLNVWYCCEVGGGIKRICLY